MSLASNALQPQRIARKIPAPALTINETEGEAAVRHTLTTVADDVESKKVKDDLTDIIKRLLPRWLRVFLNVDAIVEALVKYLARRFHPWKEDTTPAEVVR